jgi:hypothetical protein
MSSTEGAKYSAIISLFQSYGVIIKSIQGRRTALRSVLAPGFNISRLWR